MQLDTVVNTDALTLLKGLPDNSVNCCVTSPPYFGLRDYGVDGQLGLEETPEQYVAALVEVFREVKRVLRDDGTCWLNLGDSYSGSANSGGANQNDGGPAVRINGLGVKAAALGNKQLLMIPARVALALQADGWYLRSEIIWHKPNCMPESVTDRPTKAHETVFLLTKTATYWYDAEAIKEPLAPDTLSKNGIVGGKGYTVHRTATPEVYGRTEFSGNMKQGAQRSMDPNGRNKRSVWTIPTQPFDKAHFAVMPEALVEPCVLAGCPETVCAVCGAPYERQVERETDVYNAVEGRRQQLRNKGVKTGGTQRVTLGKTDHVQRTDNGFAPTCTCNAGTAHGVVLDPFGGAATVGVVAKRLNRHYLLSEINAAYVELARDRLAGVTPMLAGFAAVSP